MFISENTQLLSTGFGATVNADFAFIPYADYEFLGVNKGDAVYVKKLGSNKELEDLTKNAEFKNLKHPHNNMALLEFEHNTLLVIVEDANKDIKNTLNRRNANA